MGLSSDLISQFSKVVNNKTKTPTESTHFGTAVEYNGKMYVKLDGSDALTPVFTTTDMEAGERVSVLIKNHSATVTGNISSPAARTDAVKQIAGKVTEVEILLADRVTTEQLEAQIARIDTLTSDNVIIKDTLIANKAEIDSLIAEDATIKGRLTATEADIDHLRTDKIDASIVEATYATIKELEATDIKVNNLQATYGDFVILTTDKFTAVEADIKDLNTDRITASEVEAKYANIDFANIGEAAIKKFYATSGIIKDGVFQNGAFTGELVGVTIKGDLIEGGTVVADKLVIKGTDGLYYKLNTDGVTTEAEQTDYNSLNGSIITAKSITASKISVKDLVAFGATIGGFHISDSSIYSGVKASVDNTTNGVYLDNNGQIAFGNASQFVKFYKKPDGSYALDISADSLSFGSSKTSVESVISEMKTETASVRNIAQSAQDDINNLEVGGRNLLKGTSDNWINVSIGQWNGMTAHGRVHYESLGLKPGDTITYSLELNAINKPLRARMDFYTNSSGEDGKNAGSGTIVIPAGKSGVSYVTRTIVKDTPYIWFAIGNYDTSITATTVEQYRCIKVEKGNIPTDWTPAPEDIEADVDALTTRVSTNETNISKNSEAILLRATKTEVAESLSRYYTKEQTDSALSVKANEITSSVSSTYATKTALDNVEKQTLWRSEHTIDMTSYSESLWIPVRPDVGLPSVQGYQTIRVVSVLGYTGVPSWSTHSSGFSVDLEIEDRANGWGTMPNKPIIRRDYYAHCSTSPVSYKQLTYSSTPIVYLRGGGKYRIYTTWKINAWTPYPDGYTWTSGSYSQSAPTSTTRPTPDGDSYASNKDLTTNYATKSEVTQTANSITSSVSSTYATKSALASTDSNVAAAKSELANLEVGGRNYFRNSNFEKVYVGGTTSKHEGLSPSEWSAYNGGIDNPTTSYHAHVDYDTFGYNVIEYNESDGTRNWKGISQTLSNVDSYKTNWRISADLYATGAGTRIYGGFHCYLTGGTSQGFHAGQFSLAPTEVNKWERLSTEVKMPANIDLSKDVRFYIYGYSFSTNSILYMANPSLNISSKTVDWTPAPEDMATDQRVNDVQATVEQMDKDIEDRFEKAESIIRQLSNCIDMLVIDANGTTLLEQTSEGWTFSLSDLNTSISTVSTDLAALETSTGSTADTVSALEKAVDSLEKTAEYVRIGTYESEPCIELGKSGSEFRLMITNTRIMFMKGDDIPTYIDTTGLVTQNITIEHELRQGEWIWKRRANGNYGLQWKEVTS